MPDKSLYSLEIALDLTEAGAQMRAARHRREHPEATNDEVDAVVRAWMTERPGAPLGDAVGRPVDIASILDRCRNSGRTD